MKVVKLQMLQKLHQVTENTLDTKDSIHKITSLSNQKLLMIE